MPQRPSLSDLYGGPGAATPPARPPLEDLYGASGFDMNHIADLEREFGITPAPPQELISRGRNAPRARTSADPERGTFMDFVDRVANASPRDWVGNAVRYGGGYLSGIPSAVPGLGSLVGGALGGGSEALAELIQGEDLSSASIGVGAGVGMIPFGGIVGTGARAGARAAGAGLLSRAAAVGAETGANALKGATLGAGQEMAYRFGEGQLPGRDYGVRELAIPTLVGAGGLALAGEVGSRAAERLGGTPHGAPGGGAAINTPDGPVLEGGSPEARRANYRYDYQGGPRPSLDELYGHLKPEPLDVSSIRPNQPYTPPAEPRASTLGSDPRRINQPLREGGPVDLNGPEPFLTDTPADFPSLQGPGRPQGFDPRRAGSPVRPDASPIDLSGPEPFLASDPGDMPGMMGPGRPQGMDPRRAGWPTPIRRPEDAFFTGFGGNDRMPGSTAVRGAQEALGAGERPDASVLRFFGMEPTAPNVASERPTLAPGGDLPPAAAPVPGEPPAPTVGRMTAAQLLERLKQGDASVAMRGLTGEQIPRDWSNELRLMLGELEEFPFRRAEPNTNLDELVGGPGVRDFTQGAGEYVPNPDYPNLTQTTAGAPVFHDIMGGRSGSRAAAARGLSRVLEGGRPTSLTDRAVDVAQQRLLGGLGRSLPPDVPDVNISRGPSAGGSGRFGDFLPPSTPAAAATPLDVTGTPGGSGAGDIHPRIQQLYDELVPKWEADVANQQQRGDPFIIDPRETLEDFNRRIMESDPRELWSKERKLRAAIDAEKAGGGESGFGDLGLLMPLGGAAAGAVGGAAADQDDPWTGTAAGAALGALAGFAGHRMMRGGAGAAALERPGARPPSRDFLGELGHDDPLAAAQHIVSTPNSDVPNVRPDSRFHLGDASPEAGFTDPRLLMSLGGAAAGAVGGSVLEPDHPLLGAVAGGGLGFLATNPRAQKAVAPYLYDAMLSALATPKNVLGVTGSIAGAAFEHPERARDILGEFFSGQTLRDAKADFLNPHGFNRWAPEGEGWRGPFTRAMGAVDQATNSALQRAGFAEDQARSLTGTSDPMSGTGKSILSVARNNPLILPFARTGINLFEQGMLRTPGVNMLPAVRAMENPGISSVGRRSMLGLAAIAGGLGYAGLSDTGGPLEDMKGSTLEKVMMPGFGMASVPATIATAAMRGFQKGGTPLEGMNAANKSFWDQLPLPEAVPPQEGLARFAPGIGAYLSPVDPNKFETRGGIFDPTIARIPFANELLLDRKGGRGTKHLPVRRPAAKPQAHR